MVLRRFVSIRGYPSKLYSDNGAQLVSANEELKRVIKDLDPQSLKQFGLTQGLQWIFSSADAPWQNGVSEALIKSIKKAIKIVIDENVMTFSELQIVCFEAANLVNEGPIGRHPTSPDDESYYAPMIFYSAVQPHEYQADRLRKQTTHGTGTNSSRKLQTISGENGQEITSQVLLYSKSGTQQKETLKR